MEGMKEISDEKLMEILATVYRINECMNAKDKIITDLLERVRILEEQNDKLMKSTTQTNSHKTQVC